MNLNLEFMMSNENELKWLAHYREMIGFKMDKFGKLNPLILNHVSKAFKLTGQQRYPMSPGDPISAPLLGGVFCAVGLGSKLPSGFYKPSAWLKSGVGINKPAYGCVAVCKRGEAEIVGLVVGKTIHGSIKVLSVNDNVTVTVCDYHPDDIIGYRWVGESNNPSLYRYDLPVIKPGTINSRLYKGKG